MQERSPLILAVDCNDFFDERFGREKIHDKVEARPARQAINRAEAQNDRFETITA